MITIDLTEQEASSLKDHLRSLVAKGAYKTSPPAWASKVASKIQNNKNKQSYRSLKICLGAALFCINQIKKASGDHDPKVVRHAANKEIPWFERCYKEQVLK